MDENLNSAEMLSVVLDRNGFTPTWCRRGDQALDAFHQARPDLVLLDMLLPSRDGLTICRDIRAQSDVPIVMLAVSADTDDVVASLEAGADDYLTKPITTLELLARIHARLRHAPTLGQKLQTGDLTIDVDAHTVTRGSQAIEVTTLEFDLLLTLARRPGHAVSRTDLLRQVLGYPDTSNGRRLVNVHIQRLRSKIETDPQHPQIVLTVRGVGYKASDTSDGASDPAA